MDLASLLYRLRHDLGDLRRRRWPDDQILLSYLNEGLCELYQARPELFARTCAVELKPGTEQCVESCCQIMCITGVFDANGKRVASINESAEDDPEIEYPLEKASCLSGSAWSSTTDRTVTRYKGAKQCFSIEPAITDCDTLSVKAEVACQPPPLTLDMAGDIDGIIGCSQMGPVLHYALAMARRGPIASAAERQAAADDMSIFTGGVGVRAATDKRRKQECGDVAVTNRK